MKERRKHPYLEEGFWNKPENQFWNTEMYSEKSKRKLEAGLKVRIA
jgi:hypothetical protein